MGAGWCRCAGSRALEPAATPRGGDAGVSAAASSAAASWPGTLRDYDRVFPEASSSAVLTQAQVALLASAVCGTYVPGEVDPAWVCAVCEVESGRRCNAERKEPHLGDSSVGLVQTLVETARFCHDSLGRTAYGRPDALKLRRPTVSLYFGAAYLAYLRTYGGVRRSEAWVIRAYNGGPGGADKGYTEAYLDKYLLAKQGLERAGRGTKADSAATAARGGAGSPRRHIVLAGDTLGGIAATNGLSLARLLAFEGNHTYRADPDLIRVGDVVALE